jgi:two-component system, LytTR family, sensor kinase
MWFGLIAKIFYTYILWRWVLPSFRAKRSFFVFLSIVSLLIVFFSIEILASWQYHLFSLSHMVRHPSLAFWLNLVIYLVITLVAVAIFFTREAFRNERLNRAIMENQLTTELNFLHAQINPHFLFNTLNNLFSVAQRHGNDELARSISMLSGLMRYMLYDSRMNRVSLESEIDHLRDFIGLARMRFSTEEVDVKLEITGTIEEATIAPMILLPFVENAFKHGVSIEKKSIVEITIQVEGDQILFTCKNPKSNMNTHRESNGIGLENVRRRLSLLYPGQHTLEIIDSDYFTVDLTLRL